MDDFQTNKTTQSTQKSISPAMKERILKRRRTVKVVRRIIAVAVVLLVILLGMMYWSSHRIGIKKNQFQAVFLTNGQVYFGKLKNTSGDYLVMSDVYYLQVQSQTAQKSSDNSAQQETQTSTADPKLIKLGQELHGPEDEIHILRTQISFWENLKDSGKVVQAIKQNEKK